MNTLERAIYNFLKEEPFYAQFVLNCKIEYNVRNVPTLGIGVYNHTLSLAINTEFFEALSSNEQQAVLKHEIMHAVLEHCGTRIDKDEWRKNRQNINIAMDCAINQYIKDLPKGCVTLDGLSKMLNKSLAPFEAWEYYYGEITQFAKDNPDKCEPSPNDHEYMVGGEEGEGAPMSAEEAKAVVKDAVSKAVKTSKGKIPGELATILNKLNEAASVNWKQQLRNIVCNVKSPLNKNTRLKPNRRYDLDQPGKKKIKTLVLGVCCDSSGSVSDEQYAMFMREIRSLANNTAITYMVQADCAISKVDIIKNGKASESILSSRHGGGGTAYQPAIDYCMERGCDAIIYFGDMDSADNPKNPGVPFIWARVGSSKPPGEFGKIVDVV